MDDNLDRQIDCALAAYSDAEPLAGLEERIVARVRLASARRRRWWWAAAVPAAAAVAVVLIYPRPPAPAPVARVVPSGSSADFGSAAARRTKQSRAATGDDAAGCASAQAGPVSDADAAHPRGGGAGGARGIPRGGATEAATGTDRNRTHRNSAIEYRWQLKERICETDEVGCFT